MIVRILLISLALLIIALIGFRLYRASFFRSINWINSLRKTSVDKQGAKFSDFVSMTNLSMSLLVLAFGWFNIVLQTRKAELEQASRDLQDHILSVQKLVEEKHQEVSRSLTNNEEVRLQTPPRDDYLIGSHVDLAWSNPKHLHLSSYAVEVSRKQQAGLKEFIPGNLNDSCSLDRHRSCTFVATDPAGERAQLDDRFGALAGEYLWRVAPVDRSFTEAPVQQHQLGNWSEYSSFSIYPNISARLQHTHAVRVGTIFSQDPRFSSSGLNGKPAGRDMDLIRILVEQCLNIRNDGSVEYNEATCNTGVDDYILNSRYLQGQRAGQLRVDVVPQSDIGQGLEALQKKDLDVYIGSLTKAKTRESNDVAFTDGYYVFQSRLYARGPADQATFTRWRKGRRSIGVIDNSSNALLANLLAEEDDKRELTVVYFDSFPALENAFDREDVSAILVDDVRGEQLRRSIAGVVEINGLDNTAAWERFHSDPGYLGYETEEFGIATVTDVPVERTATTVKGLLREAVCEGPRSSDRGSLFSGLQRSLRSAAIKERLLPELCHLYTKGIDNPNCKPHRLPLVQSLFGCFE